MELEDSYGIAVSSDAIVQFRECSGWLKVKEMDDADVLKIVQKLATHSKIVFSRRNGPLELQEVKKAFHRRYHINALYFFIVVEGHIGGEKVEACWTEEQYQEWIRRYMPKKK